MNQLLIESVAKQNLDFASIGSQLSQLNDTLIDVRSRLEATEPHIKPSVLLAEAGASPHARAFNKLKAEDFDHDYTHLASLFHSPWDYELLTGEDNMIIEGGRGCGKSMILKSMELRAAVELVRLQRFQQRQSITFAESGLRYFGIYVKLPSGMFHEWDADCALTMNKAVTLFQHVFNMMMLRGVLENLRSAQRAGIVHLSESGETAFCKDICLRIGISESYDRIEAVLRAVQLELNAVQDYMVQLRLENPAAVFKGHATSIHSFLNECCESIRSNTDDLKNVRFYLLLDEYENFSEQQQRVVNTLGKNRPPSLTLKIATRRLGIKARTDLGGEPMQKPRDYLVTYLDYDPNDARYAEMLAAIVRKRLSAAGYAFGEIRDLLATPPKYHPAEPDDVFRIIEKSAEAIGGSALSHLKSGDTRELYHRFERAAVFRACEANFSPYTYAGFDDFVLLSSGIVSNFLMLCRMSFYMAEMDNISVRAGTPIPWSCQSRAVYDVSQTAMENISTNIQDYGGAISRLVRDLADFIRVKLLKHQTEPESSRVQITDPGRLDDQECQQAQTILNEAVRWSVLHEVSEESSYRPKQKEKPRPKDFLINRILCPMLKISPRPRWAIKIAVSDICKRTSAPYGY